MYIFDLLVEGDYMSLINRLVEIDHINQIQSKTITNSNNNSNNHVKNNNSNNNNNDNKVNIYEEYEMCLSYLVNLTVNNQSLTEIKEILHCYSSKMSIHMAMSLTRITQYQYIDTKSYHSFIQEEIQFRKKLSHLEKKTTLIDITENIGDLFENGDITIKLRLVLSDLIGLLDYSDRQQELNLLKKQQQQPQQHQLDIHKYECSILDIPIYQEELCFILPFITFKFNDIINFNNMLISLLYLNQAPKLMHLLILNHPLEFKEIVEDIILKSIELVGFERIKRILLELCKLSKFVATFIRAKLIEQTLMPELIFMITTQFIKDDINFLSNIIVNRQEYQWIKDYISQRESPSFNEIRDNLLSILDKSNNNQMNTSTSELNSPTATTTTTNTTTNGSIQSIITIQSIVRIYCGMAGVLGIKLSGAEITATLQLIDKYKSKSFSRIYLCFLLVIEGLLRIIQPKRISECFNNILKTNSCDDLLLLISIYFHTRQLPNIVVIVKNILGFRPSIHTESLNQIGELLTKDIFPEALVALKASLLPTTDNLSNGNTSNISGSGGGSSGSSSGGADNHNTSMMCIYHLLSERIFEKYETDMGQWIWTQTLKASTPIHYLLPSCLDKLIKKTVDSNEYTIVLYEEDIRVDDIIVVCAVKTDTYGRTGVGCLLCTKTSSILIETTQLKEYSDEFLSKLPIQSCLNTIQSNAKDYFYIIPPFFYLVSSQFPQLFNVALLLEEEERHYNSIATLNYIPQYFKQSIYPKSADTKYTVSVFQKTTSNPTTTYLILSYLNTLPDASLTALVIPLVQHLLPILIDNFQQPQIDGIIPLFTDLWSRLFPLDQTNVALKTINLSAFLAERYPIPKSLRICRYALGRIAHNLGVNLTSTHNNNSSNSTSNIVINVRSDFEKDNFIKQILPSLTRFAKTYPILAEDCLQILTEQLPNKQLFNNNSNNNGAQPNNNADKSQHQQFYNGFSTPTLEQQTNTTPWIKVNDKTTIHTDIYQAIQILVKNITN
ncbi:integrator complex subunit 2 [Heterostelium album PN500]|uniref:Integrator complex subunit 2 n=1 Tax=Heterostelium pallidum (strain ATCC 26659 / Pp 5 / PN500) TaxID=670386 RepID=D3BNS1_HETP5|nr:integrator complex subunit 2 [Heterostelium album PN500]EFA76840.1 integrator complex subunit 2 [Heterostelium album PN500]|eukprot:XP_020428972.1 integrator complex subunit 2 [Heterostelium album PN500]